MTLRLTFWFLRLFSFTKVIQRPYVNNVSLAVVRFFAKLYVTLTVTQYLESLYEPNVWHFETLHRWSERLRSIAYIASNIKTINLILAPCIFCRITEIYQRTNAHIISHKRLLKNFKTLRHVSILSDHHQGA